MSDEVTISVDAMGGDEAPKSVIDGVAKLASSDPKLRFILHGDTAKLEPLIAQTSLSRDIYTIKHTDEIVRMEDKPSVAVRRGRNSSMWRALESVRDGDAAAAVSAGNTGALMAMALFCLNRAQGVDRPAIAALWPTAGDTEHCVVLDMGADIRADAADLVTYAVMGTEYARIALGIETPRVGVLNVGIEDTKGRPEEREAAEMLRNLAEKSGDSFSFAGFVEANAITKGVADVVVTDGFSGNVALKAAEGTARFISDNLRSALTNSWRGRLAGLFATASLRDFKRRIDPRRVNGGVFLGLNGLVVKSHGSTDATGFAAALSLAARMARADFRRRIALEVEKSVKATQDGSTTVAPPSERP